MAKKAKRAGKKRIAIALQFEASVPADGDVDLDLLVKRLVAGARAKAGDHRWKVHVLDKGIERPKVQGISRTLPDRDWIEKVVTGEGVPNCRVKKASKRSYRRGCSWGGRREDSFMIRQSDLSEMPSDMGEQKARDIQEKEFPKGIIGWGVVSPLRWAVLHEMVHVVLRKRGNDVFAHGVDFWTEFRALLTKYMPEALTAEAVAMTGLLGT